MNAAEVLTPLPKLVRDEFDRDNYEVIDGVQVEVPPMSVDSQALASQLAHCLNTFGVSQNLGAAYVEMLFRLPLSMQRNRRPDVAFVPYTRWPRTTPFPATNAWDVLPTLCVEVISPNDMGDEVETKINEYFQAGVSLVWVVYPRQQRCYVYDTPAQVRRLTPTDTLDGGTVLPGFQLPLTELFLQAPPAPPPAP